MRIFLAIRAFFKILFSYEYGQSVRAITDGTSQRIQELENEREKAQADISTIKEQLNQSQEAVESLTSDMQKLAATKETLERELKASSEKIALAEHAKEKAMASAASGPAILLSLLQREGRLIDFMMEAIEDFDDDQIGAAIRPVHSGCQKVFKEYVTVTAITNGVEGDRITIEQGFDPSAIKLSGKVKGTPPFKGTLHHHGWKIETLNLPQRPESHSPEVIAPAEVEIGAP